MQGGNDNCAGLSLRPPIGQIETVVIPVHDVNPVRRTPWLTYGLIAVNVVILLLTPLFSNSGLQAETVGDLCRQQAFFDHYGAIAHELITNHQDALVFTGQVGERANTCALGPPDYTKIPALSVLTSMFLHAGWLHLLGNMLFLWVFGNNIEDRFGRLRFLLIYLAAGYAAAYGYAFASPESTQPLVGASGAISGILGAYIVLFPKARVWSLVPLLLFIPLRLPAWLVLGMWFVLQGLYSAGIGVAQGGDVAYLAHVLGFVVGILFAWRWRGRFQPPQGRRPPPPDQLHPPVMWRRPARGGWR
jgi:membrane associated rhomboid family serine protease